MAVAHDRLTRVAHAVIRELGVGLEERWRRSDFDIDAFPGLAAEALAGARVAERVAVDEIVEAAFRKEIPPQCDPGARFGQPPVTLFRGERFYVDALFWVDGTTVIHDHAFAGAFEVLDGSSIETTYTFAPARDVDGHLLFGELRVDGSTLRRPGQVQTIRRGPAFIHSLFHLARPSVSLVVRTFSDGVQLEYTPAGIAFDSFPDDEWRDRIVQLSEMLRKTAHPRFEELVGDLVGRVDLGVACAVLRSCAPLADASLLGRLIRRLPDAEVAERLEAWVAHRRRIEFLISRRAFVREPHLRFLLALLLNAQRRPDVLDLVRAFDPGERPEAKVAEWLAQLSRTTVRLQLGDGPFAPNVLGLPAFDADAERTIAAFLSGDRSAWTGERQAFIDRLRALSVLAPLFAD